MTEDKLENITKKIRLLLNKAEGTDNEHEAESFMAAAIKLMKKYTIDEAILMQKDTSNKSEPIIRDIIIPASTPGNKMMSVMLNSIAIMNQSKVWRTRGTTVKKSGKIVRNSLTDTYRLAGFPTDVHFIDMLYTSLLLQMESALMREMPNKPQGVHGRVFRTSFISGFVSRVIDRLSAMNDEAEDDGEVGTALVLRDRAAEVDDFVNNNVGKLSKTSSQASRTDFASAMMGARAGDQANLNVNGEVSTGIKGVLA